MSPMRISSPCCGGSVSYGFGGKLVCSKCGSFVTFSHSNRSTHRLLVIG